MKTFDVVLKACWDSAWVAANATTALTPPSVFLRDLAYADWRAALAEPPPHFQKSPRSGDAGVLSVTGGEEWEPLPASSTSSPNTRSS